jgi:transposase
MRNVLQSTPEGREVKKLPKQEYTAEFMEQAVKRAQEVSLGTAARELGLVEQTLRNWV